MAVTPLLLHTVTGFQRSCRQSCDPAWSKDCGGWVTADWVFFSFCFLLSPFLIMWASLICGFGGWNICSRAHQNKGRKHRAQVDGKRHSGRILSSAVSRPAALKIWRLTFLDASASKQTTGFALLGEEQSAWGFLMIYSLKNITSGPATAPQC